VIVAPPGTGKTHLSVRLAGAIAPDLAESERVLLVTFSNQARVQLEHEGARQLDAALRRRVVVANYHGFFWRAVWANRRALGLPLNTQIGSRRQRLEALRGVEPEIVKDLKGEDGLLESLSEHQFTQFRDERTPNEDALGQLLAAIDAEQRAGRLVFDDLGALFWKLLETFPVLDAAYKSRFPVILADEHQDASALQDAVVRRLASRRIAVFADPMQLIYGFRGSRPERLKQHLDECDQRFELRTAHRWHGQTAAGEWLLAVRRRLQGDAVPATRPDSCVIRRARYFNQMKPLVKYEVAAAFGEGSRTVAVLATWRADVAKLRSYLCQEGFFPRQVGGDDFEEARDDIEQLPLLSDPQSVGHRAIDRVTTLVPTLRATVVEQVKRRLKADGVDLSGNCGPEARGILTALGSLYETGAPGYVRAVVNAMEACTARGHHLPRVEAVRALRAASDAYDAANGDLDEVLSQYAATAATASQIAPRLNRGLFVMTVHQAKGKEFDVVIVVNAGERQFGDNEADRRLFYVAITRGARRWVVIAPEQDPSPLVRAL
jgi:DNA helicase-2/ATP-dependent DNA helicase PcrA